MYIFNYMYIHVHDCMKPSEYVHSLYHVQICMYHFAQSCPGGQDSRCAAFKVGFQVSTTGQGSLPGWPGGHIWNCDL